MAKTEKTLVKNRWKETSENVSFFKKANFAVSFLFAHWFNSHWDIILDPTTVPIQNSETQDLTQQGKRGALILGGLPLKKDAVAIIKKCKELEASLGLVVSLVEPFEQEGKGLPSPMIPVSENEWKNWEEAEAMIEGEENTNERTPIQFLSQPMRDYTAEINLENLTETIDAIEEYRKKGESVYVHCKAGKGRSWLVVAAYLMVYEKMPEFDAAELIRTKRPSVTPGVSRSEKVRKLIEDFQWGPTVNSSSPVSLVPVPPIPVDVGLFHKTETNAKEPPLDEFIRRTNVLYTQLVVSNLWDHGLKGTDKEDMYSAILTLSNDIRTSLPDLLPKQCDFEKANQLFYNIRYLIEQAHHMKLTEIKKLESENKGLYRSIIDILHALENNVAYQEKIVARALLHDLSLFMGDTTQKIQTLMKQCTTDEQTIVTDITGFTLPQPQQPSEQSLVQQSRIKDVPLQNDPKKLAHFQSKIEEMKQTINNNTGDLNHVIQLKNQMSHCVTDSYNEIKNLVNNADKTTNQKSAVYNGTLVDLMKGIVDRLLSLLHFYDLLSFKGYMRQTLRHGWLAHMGDVEKLPLLATAENAPSVAAAPAQPSEQH